MKKIIFCLMALCAPFTICAQDSVKFSIQPTGQFIAEDGKDFAVVEFEGKTAAELYNMVKENVMDLYKDPKEVMSENEGQSIKIRGFAKIVAIETTLIFKSFYGAYYNLSFKFKDGKIRVDAPSIDNEFTLTAGGTNMPQIVTLNTTLSSCYKKGKLVEKKKNKIELLEENVNVPINYLLGLSKKKTQEEDDDNW